MKIYNDELNYKTYKKITNIAEVAKDKVTEQLYDILGENKSKINFMEARIKTYNSLVDKMKFKGYELNISEMLENINDLIGIRFVCKNINAVYSIVNDIKDSGKIIIITEKDYIRYPKKSGYRSLHLIMEPVINIQNYKYTVKVELQIRTYEMQLWANWAHDLIYKKNMRNSPELVGGAKIFNKKAVI